MWPPLRPLRRPSPAPSGAGSADPGDGEGPAASKAPFSVYRCRGLLRRGYGIRNGLPGTGGKRGARRRHPARRGESRRQRRLASISSSLSLSPPCAGQQRSCSRRSRQPWRAGPGTRGGRGPLLSPLAPAAEEGRGVASRPGGLRIMPPPLRPPKGAAPWASFSATPSSPRRPPPTFSFFFPSSRSTTACPRAAAGMAERHEAAAFAAARLRPIRGECTWLARLRRSSPAVGPSPPQPPPRGLPSNTAPRSWSARRRPPLPVRGRNGVVALRSPAATASPAASTAGPTSAATPV
jgi:hypothetical protein